MYVQYLTIVFFFVVNIIVYMYLFSYNGILIVTNFSILKSVPHDR